MSIHILHLHSTFALGGKEARAVQLMNAFGDRARHTIVSAMPDQLGAREAIDRHIKYEIALDPPPLTGRPSVKRYEQIARFMRRFDLVLTDHHMPSKSGLDLIVELRANPAYKATPILVLTTEDGEPFKDAARAAGATGWIEKPLDPDLLTEVVAAIADSQEQAQH